MPRRRTNSKVSQEQLEILADKAGINQKSLFAAQACATLHEAQAFAKEMYCEVKNGKRKYSYAEISEALFDRYGKVYSMQQVAGWARRQNWDGELAKRVFESREEEGIVGFDISKVLEEFDEVCGVKESSGQKALKEVFNGSWELFRQSGARILYGLKRGEFSNNEILKLFKDSADYIVKLSEMSDGGGTGGLLIEVRSEEEGSEIEGIIKEIG